MDEEVIVGTGSGGQKNIVEALSDAGLSVCTTDMMWPRDHYVSFQGNYLVSGSPGSITGNPYGEGGKIITGENSVLVSDMAHVHVDVSKRISRPLTKENAYQVVKEEGEKYFSGAQVHVAPSGYFHNGKGHSHIDMFTLLLPKRKVFFLDTHFAKGAGTAREYDEIAEQEGWKLIRYDGKQDDVWYPLNAFTCTREDTDIALIDKKAKSLATLLMDKGVKVLETEMPQHQHPMGKIRCQTNTYKKGFNVDGLLSTS